MIGYFPDGFKAIYSVAKALDTSETNYEVVGSATIIGTGILQPDTAYPLKISYDQPTNVFTFSVNGTEVTFDADTAPTPALYAREPVRDFKGVNIAAFGGNADGFTSATFDDVEVNGVLRDDFSTPFLDQTKWRYREAVGEVANGKARLNIQANGSMDEVTAYFPNNDFNYLEAKILVESSSYVSAGATGIVRLAGYYYNEVGAPYNGNQNDVWIDFRITLDENGVLAARCTGIKHEVADPWGAYTSRFYYPFAKTIAFDTEYTLSIERKGTSFIFKLDDETYTYNVETPMFEPAQGQARQLRTRIYADPGETGYMRVTGDDVCISKGGSIIAPISLLLLQDTTVPIYDDFSDPMLDPQKWTDREFERKIVEGELLLENTSRLGGGEEHVVLNFSDPMSVNTIESTITVSSSTSIDTVNGKSMARIGGIFYNTQATGGATGDVFATVRIGNIGLGLEAWWRIFEYTNDDRTEYTVIGSGDLVAAPANLSYDTPYQAKISYNETENLFTFTVNGQSGTFDGDTDSIAPRLRDPVTLYKALNIYTAGNAGDGFTSATFDDVIVNEVAYDDFSAPVLDLTKWSPRLEKVRDIDSNKARLNVRTKDTQRQSTLRFPNNDFNYLEAKLLVTSNSFIATGATGVTRLAGYYYNDSVAFPTGFTGNVWTDFRLSLNSSGVLSANCFGYKLTTDDEYGPGEMVFNHPFTTTLAFDTEYSLSIERKGTIFIFKLDDESFTYNVTTPMYEP